MPETKKALAFNFNVLISVIVAFCAWVYVVYNFYPTKNVEFVDVPISYSGEEILAEENIAIESTSAETINLTLSVRRADYARVSADKISVVADVSNITEGDNQVSLTIAPPGGSTLVRSNIDTITVKAEPIATKTVEAVAVFSDAVEITEEPVYLLTSNTEVTVTGTESNVERVSFVQLRLKASDVSGAPHQYVVKPVATDSNGNAILHVLVNPNEVSLTAVTGITKTVDIVYNIKDESGIHKNSKLPKKVTIKGSAVLIASIQSVETEVIDLTDITEDTNVPLRFKLPAGINVAQSSMGLVMNVSVDGAGGLSDEMDSDTGAAGVQKN